VPKNKPAVMMIDNNADHHTLLAEGIGAANPDATLTFYDNGHDALKALSAGPPYPDFIVLDWNLPLLNGANMLRILKLTDKYKDIPVFILSACEETMVQELCRTLGCRDYYVKPREGGYSEIVRKMFDVLNT
jgi:CheY-like chemotaxis protein